MRIVLISFLLSLSLILFLSQSDSYSNLFVFHMGYHSAARVLPLAFAFDVARETGFSIILTPDDCKRYMAYVLALLAAMLILKMVRQRIKQELES